LARAHGWWHDVMGCMQGLRKFYEHVGRTAQWGRLVDELIPDLTDPGTDGPVPGRDEYWSIFTEYRVDLALTARDYPTAHRLQTRRVTWNRDRAADALTTPPDQATDRDHNRIRTLSVSLEALGNILREQQHPDCVTNYNEAINLCRRIGAGART